MLCYNIGYDGEIKLHVPYLTADFSKAFDTVNHTVGLLMHKISTHALPHSIPVFSFLFLHFLVVGSVR